MEHPKLRRRDTSRSLYALDVTGSQINSHFPVVCGPISECLWALPVQNEKKTHPPASVAVGGGVCVADKHPASRHGMLTMFPFGAGIGDPKATNGPQSYEPSLSP